MGDLKLVKLLDGIQVLVDVSTAQFTEGIAYESMFQTSRDTEYHRLGPGYYKINVSSNPTATLIDLPNLLAVIDSITINSVSLLDSLSAPKLVTCPAITISNNPELTTVDLALLQAVTPLQFLSNAVITTLSLPTLNASNININGNTLLATLDLPSFVTGQLNLGGADAIVDLDLSAMIGDANSSVSISSETLLESVDLSNLVSAGGVGIGSCPLLDSFDLSSYIHSNGSSVGLSSNPSLVSFALNSALDCTALNLNDNAFDVTSVDGILASIDTAGYTAINHTGSSGGSFVIGDTITGGTSGAVGVISYVDDSVMRFHITSGLFISGETLDNGGGVTTVIDSFGAILDLSGGANASPTGGAVNVNKVSLEAKGWSVTVN